MDANIKINDLQIPNKRQQAMIWVRQSEIVDAAADWFQSLPTRIFAQRSEPLHLSGDDEHMWIGLAP